MSLFQGNEILTSVDRVKRLAALLAKAPQVTRHDSHSHQEAEALADSFAEMEKLMIDLATTENPYHCPHGRPITETLTHDDLLRLFKRM